MRIKDYDLVVRVDKKPISELIEESTNTTWIPAQKGKEFQVYIFNNDDRRIVAVPLIDGLSVMDGKPGGVHSGGYILKAHAGVSIPGWRIDSETVAEFTFDSVSKGLSQFVKNDNRDIGVIQCAIYREKQSPKSRPKYVPPIGGGHYQSVESGPETQAKVRPIYEFGGGHYRSVEPPTPQKNALPSAGGRGVASPFIGSQQEETESLAVGFGAAKAHHITVKSFTRESAKPLCVLSIRYESSINLAKRSQSVTSKTEYCDHWLQSGVKAMMANCVDEAITAFTRVVKVSPNVEEAWEALVSAYESTGDFELLVNATANLARLRYKDGNLWRKLGVMYLNRELWANTIEPFDKYNELEPGKADSWNCIGMGLAKTGQLDEAWYCCSKALQINPESYDAWDALGIVHQQSGRMADAVDAFSKAVALNPQHEGALCNLWTTYSQMNRKEDASLILTRLREVNPLLASKMH